MDVKAQVTDSKSEVEISESCSLLKVFFILTFELRFF